MNRPREIELPEVEAVVGPHLRPGERVDGFSREGRRMIMVHLSGPKGTNRSRGPSRGGGGAGAAGGCGSSTNVGGGGSSARGQAVTRSRLRCRGTR